MKALHAVLVLCGVALGALLASLAPAVAQPERAAPPPRLQVSAFAGQAVNGDMVHGCYTIDTTTGETWMSLAGGVPQKVPDAARGK